MNQVAPCSWSVPVTDGEQVESAVVEAHPYFGALGTLLCHEQYCSSRRTAFSISASTWSHTTDPPLLACTACPTEGTYRMYVVSSSKDVSGVTRALISAVESAPTY